LYKSSKNVFSISFILFFKSGSIIEKPAIIKLYI
jgi:hypothetical protein